MRQAAMALGLCVLVFGLVRGLPPMFAGPRTEVSLVHAYAGFVPAENVVLTGGLLRSVSVTAGTSATPDAIAYIPLVYEGWRGDVKVVVRATHDEQPALQRAQGRFEGTLTRGVDQRLRERFAEAGVKVDPHAWVLDYGDDPAARRNLGLALAGGGLAVVLVAWFLGRRKRA